MTIKTHRNHIITHVMPSQYQFEDLIKNNNKSKHALTHSQRRVFLLAVSEVDDRKLKAIL